MFKKILILAIALIGSFVHAQEDFRSGETYILGGIEVTGLKTYNEQTVVSYTGLSLGQEITVPGEELSAITKKLWELELFANINFYVVGVQEGKVYLELAMQELPTLSDFKIVGIKEKKQEEVAKDTELKKGKKVTESFISNTKNYLTNKYKKEGYLNNKIVITTQVDTTEGNAVKMLININKGEKIKVKDIDFVGNDKLSNKKLRKAMKNTKQKAFLRFWKKSKFIPEDYEADLTSIINKYKESGYRDARILSDSVIFNDNNTISLQVKLEEGKKYYFGDIDFVGNNVYSDDALSRVLGIKKGEAYNGVLLKERIADNSKPDAEDITNLYQNNGYLFSQINPVEVSVENDTINFEIRIIEGKPARLNHVTVTGNDRTNDNVIYRSLRTRPGELYDKSAIIQTIRELSQLQFFDPEQISPDIQNPDASSGTVDINYNVVEKGSSQVELQGGYGGGGFIGTLGLSFNNFALKDIFKKDAYKPVPMGDGQRLALRLQASRYYQTYSFSFAEPWFGGKEPRQLSVSFSHTQQFLYNSLTRDVDRDRRFLISGVTVGLSKRLKEPDNYFYFSQALSFQHYNLKNYNTSLFTFGNGFSNSLAYTIGLSRNASGPGVIYPRYGSDFSVTAKLTPPYSLFNNTDYDALEDERAELEASGEDSDRISEIDQERFRWLEFYKVKFKGDWYTPLSTDSKLVLKSTAEFGFLGAYNNARGLVPFERFFVGGDGMANYTLDGRENIMMRGYPNQSLSNQDGSVIYNKFSLELRYPITLNPNASIYALTFAEGAAAYDNFRQYNPFQLKRSAGLGLRIFMPAFGLLGIDFGYGFDSVDGTTNPNGWETHFVIGQQF